MTIARLVFSSAAALLCLAGPALAECEASGGDCAAELPAQCLERLGAGVLAAESGDECSAKFDAYLGCLDEVIQSCDAAPPADQGGASGGRASSGQASCGEARETALWRQVEASEDPDDFRYFLEVCPDSVFRRFAEQKIAAAEAGNAASDAAAEAAADAAATSVDLAALHERRDAMVQRLETYRAESNDLNAAVPPLRERIDAVAKERRRVELLVRVRAERRSKLDDVIEKDEALQQRLETLTRQVAERRQLALEAQREVKRLDAEIAEAEAGR